MNAACPHSRAHHTYTANTTQARQRPRVATGQISAPRECCGCGGGAPPPPSIARTANPARRATPATEAGCDREASRCAAGAAGRAAGRRGLGRLGGGTTRLCRASEPAQAHARATHVTHHALAQPCSVDGPASSPGGRCACREHDGSGQVVWPCVAATASDTAAAAAVGPAHTCRTRAGGAWWGRGRAGEGPAVCGWWLPGQCVCAAGMPQAMSPPSTS